MNVLFVSECSGNALKETRRILDQFAERRGERTWQTSITKDGLDAVRKLLRKTARKNTAIACHWIRGLDNTELLWIVGSANCFNHRGAVPTNTTTRKVLRGKSENNWHSQRDIYLLSALSALLHDLGKACDAFQARLSTPNIITRNIYRHEWISLCLFRAFVGDDSDDKWLARLAEPSEEDNKCWIARLEFDPEKIKGQRPFDAMSPLAQAIGWLVVTHHRLPHNIRSSKDGFRVELLDQLPGCITADWNEEQQEVEPADVKPYWSFRHGLPVVTALWREHASRIATRLLARLPQVGSRNYLDDPFVMHISRLSLMLADHHYSSLTDDGRIKGASGYPLFANTKKVNRGSGRFINRPDKGVEFNQPLDEHLLGVEKLAKQVVYALPSLAEELPRIGRHRALRQRSASEFFRWQDKAAESAEGIRLRSQEQGAFIVNMASTGCGKTLANARIMYGLSEPSRGMRCAFALGLRTLTRQTGTEYRTRLGLSDDEVAILVGGFATSELADHLERGAASTGSESSQSLFPEDGYVIYDGGVSDNPSFSKLFADPNARKLLSAPIIACTIDHLVPATEGIRGGRQIAPMLRLLSGDLVLDELDDYDLNDLPAVARLMNWAGLLGCRVLISSATLAPSIVQGMFDSYRDGRQHFQRNRGQRPAEVTPICCLWSDEFTCKQSDCMSSGEFSAMHNEFAVTRAAHLSKLEPRRLAEIVPVAAPKPSMEAVSSTFAETIVAQALRLHERHCETDSLSTKRVSFGLVRMANIGALYEVAIRLYHQDIPPDVKIHLCVYHSQQILFMRSAMENLLDLALDRRKPERVYVLPHVRQAIDSSDEKNHLFIVLSSPVSEVGRDHDYDWAIIEPSSARSIIQLAGRVRRHRRTTCDSPNIVLLDRNFKSLTGQSCPFRRPGFESSAFVLKSNSITQLMKFGELPVIDARPRIVERVQLSPAESLVDLEHVRLREAMIPREFKPVSSRFARVGALGDSGLHAHTWWSKPRAGLSALLQRKQIFRSQVEKELDLVYLPDEDAENFWLYRIDADGNGKENFTKVHDQLSKEVREMRVISPQVVPWGHVDFDETISALAEELDLDIFECAKRFATICLPERKWQWRYHPYLGFAEYKGENLL